jgi:murein DD-endopeptidase MepM/ murein hydrolase activator NlpD
MPKTEQKQFPLGALAHEYTGKEILYHSVRPVSFLVAAEPLPKSVDLTSKQSPVILQNWGSCVAAAEKSDDEAMQIEKTGSYKEKSIKALYALCKSLDGIFTQSGTYPYMGKKVRMGLGTVDLEVYPDTAEASEDEYKKYPPDIVIDNAHDQIPGVVFLVTDDDKKHFLNKERQFTCTLPVYSNYLNPDSDGVVRIPAGEANTAPKWGLHRVLCVGFDDEKGLWKYKGSWGKSYAKDGYFWTEYSYTQYDAIGSVDWVDGAVTVGAPVNLAWPTDDHTITQHFGDNPAYYKQYGLPGHNGLDIRARNGDNIYAVDDGQVIWADLLGGYGKCVKIQHSWGMSLYAHNKEFKVTVGQQVSRKQLLALADATGNVIAGASHCHCSIRINGVKNPAYNDWVSIEPYLEKPMPKLPDEGFAQFKGAGAQIYYHKISNWNGALELAKVFKADSKKIGKIKDFASLPDKGFVFGNDNKTVSFYFRISSPEQKQLIVLLTGLDPNGTVYQFENL